MNLFMLSCLLWVAAAPWLLFPQVALSLTLLFLILLPLCRLFLARRWRRIMPATPLNGFVLVYSLLAGTAFLLTPFPTDVLPKLTTLIFSLFGYLLVLDWLWPPAGATGRPPESPPALPGRLSSLIVLLALAGGLIALGALTAVEWPQRQLWDTDFLTGRIPHLTGEFTAHPNEVAGALLFLIPFALFLIRYPSAPGTSMTRTGRVKIMGWLVLLLMLWVLFLMQSRVALLALVGVILLYFVWGRWRLRWLLLGGAGVAILLLVAGVLADVTPGQVSSWVSTADALSKQGALAPQSWPMRREVWSAAGQVLLDYPLFGAGLDSFVPVSRANYPFFAVPADLDFAHAHNLWLQAGADMGWPGILATTLLVGVPLCGLWLAARPDHRYLRDWTIPFGAGLAGYILFNLLDTISPLQRPGVLLWIILAGSAVLLAQSRVFERRVAYFALAPLVLLVMLLILPPAGRNLANWQLDRARFTGSIPPALDELTGRRQCILLAHRQEWAAVEGCFAGRPDAIIYLQSQGQRAAYAHHQEESLAWYNTALALDGRAASVYFWRGQLFEKQEEELQALADYEQAVRFAAVQGLDPSWLAHFHFHLGRAYARQSEWTPALQHIQTAVELDETQPIYFEVLGDMLLVFGDKAGAEQAYERAGKK